MTTFIVILHVVVSIALILIVLLQTGKGADMGAAFGGGGSQTLFGSSGASTFLGKATTVVAVIFMLTSLTLAYISTRNTGSSLMLDEKPPVEAPAVPGTESEQPGDTEQSDAGQDDANSKESAAGNTTQPASGSNEQTKGDAPEK